MEMRDLRLSQTFMPPDEFTRCAYQALAHGAGLKLVTLAIPERLLDARTLPRAREVFAFMKQQAEVFDLLEPVASTALVWPEDALLEGSAMTGKTAAALRVEALGLYTGLKLRHVPLRLIYDEQISPEKLRGLDALVLATAAWLTQAQAQALAAWVRAGGRLIWFDSPAADPAGFRALPRASDRAHRRRLDADQQACPLHGAGGEGSSGEPAGPWPAAAHRALPRGEGGRGSGGLVPGRAFR